MLKLVMVAMLGAGLAGCVNVQTTRLDRSHVLAPRAVDEVVIYPNFVDVPGAYRKVALLEAKGDANATDERDFRESMRRQAAKLGANGIILERGLELGPKGRLVAAVLNVQSTRYRHATAILVESPVR